MIKPISTGENKTKKVVKTVAKTVATAAVVTGTALYLAKTGKLDKFAKTETAQKAVGKLKGFADVILAKAQPIIDKIKPQVDEAVAKAKPHVDETVNKVKTSKIYEEGKAIVEKAKPTLIEAKEQATAKTKELYKVAEEFVQAQAAKVKQHFAPVAKEVVEEVVDIVK